MSCRVISLVKRGEDSITIQTACNNKQFEAIVTDDVEEFIRHVVLTKDEVTIFIVFKDSEILPWWKVFAMIGSLRADSVCRAVKIIAIDKLADLNDCPKSFQNVLESDDNWESLFRPITKQKLSIMASRILDVISRGGAEVEQRQQEEEAKEEQQSRAIMNPAPPARIFFGLDGPTVFDDRPEYVVVHEGGGEEEGEEARQGGAEGREVEGTRGGGKGGGTKAGAGELRQETEIARKQNRKDNEELQTSKQTSANNRKAFDHEKWKLENPVESSAQGFDNFGNMLKEYRIKHKRELIAETDEILMYVNHCEKLGTAMRQEYLDQISDKHLFLRQLSLGSKGGVALGKSLQWCRSGIKSIDLGFCEIGKAGCECIAEALTSLPSLSSLDLVGNRIGAYGAEALAKVFLESRHSNTSLTSLNLRDNHLGDQGAIQISKILYVNTSLRSLNLSDNEILLEGAQSIAKGIEFQHENQGVERLFLSCNNIKYQGCRMLCNALCRNKTVRTLDLSSNHVGDLGARSIADMMSMNAFLTSLDISNNDFQGAGLTQISKSLNVNKTMTFLDISNNNLDNHTMNLLITASLGQNPMRLQFFNVSTRQSDNVGVAKILGEKTFTKRQDLQAYLVEAEQKLRVAKDTMKKMEKELFVSERMIADLEHVGREFQDENLREMKSKVENTRETLHDTWTEISNLKSILEEGNQLLESWVPEANVNLQNLQEHKQVMDLLRDTSTRSVKINLRNPGHRYVVATLLDSWTRCLGMTLKIEVNRKTWKIPPKFEDKRMQDMHEACQAVDTLPKSGGGIIHVQRCNWSKRSYNLNLDREEERRRVEALRQRHLAFFSSERIRNFRHDGNLVDCFDHPKWKLPLSGRISFTMHSLVFDYDPEDIVGTLTLDLDLPWELSVAENLFEKLKQREALRQNLVNYKPSADGSSASLVLKQHKLPSWSGRCFLEGEEVQVTPSSSLPTSGVMHMVWERSSDRVPKIGIHFVLHMQYSLHRWIAEKLWTRCNRQAEFVSSEFILEYPLLNQLDYKDMHGSFDHLERWTFPDDGQHSTLELTYVVRSAKFIETRQVKWDLEIPEQQEEAEKTLYGKDAVSISDVQIMDKRTGDKRCLPIPFRPGERKFWRLPSSGIVTAVYGRLKRMNEHKLPVHVVQSVIARIDKDGQKAGKERILRKIVNEDAVFYKNLSAEQGARIFFQAFEGSDFLEKMAAADILYKNIAEPHRFLQCLAEQSSQERDAPVVENIPLRKQKKNLAVKMA